MARNRKNSVSAGFSGKVGQFIFYERYGKPIVANPPAYKPPLSEAQKAHLAKFDRATHYAKIKLLDPAIEEAYRQKCEPGQSPQNLAIKDYFKPPQIHAINLSESINPSGNSSLHVVAFVSDDFRVEMVSVKIEDANGNLLEHGNAVLQDDGLVWVYDSTITGANASGNKVSIAAVDLPGNYVVEEKII